MSGLDGVIPDIQPGLEGFRAVITGGASLIGAAIASLFARSGVTVVLGDIAEDLGHEVAEQAGERVSFVHTDVQSDDDLDRLIRTGAGDEGRIDVVITAAVTFDDNRLDTTRSEWLNAFDVNVVSAALVTRKALPHMARGGAVTYVSSVSGRRSQPNRVVYNVTKAGLLMLAQTAGQQLAPLGIRVNAVSPGWTWSRNIEHRYGSRERADEFAAEFQPLGRMADPEEVAAAVAFISSPAARFTTGSELLVDGGYSAIGPEALGQATAKVPPLEEAE
jgi:NAD(P)-dependent dehydrogenase (short-subunit alcohol dehydrogenase family)